MKTQYEMKNLHGQKYALNFDKTQNSFRLKRLCKKITLTPYDKVADFGCGSGMLMPFVAPFVYKYIGVDFSQPFIKIANEKKKLMGITNASFECTSIDEFCRHHKDFFNVAFAFDLSEHVYDESLIVIFKSIKNALVPKGRFYLHTPNARFIIEIMKKYNLILKQFPQHIAVRTLKENIFLLEKTGFSIKKILLIPHYNNILRLLHPLSFVPLVGDYFKARIFI